MQPAYVEVDLGFFPLMWILYLVSPWLSVNGHAQKQSWGKVQLSLPPGRHVFEAWYPYLFSSQQSKGTLVIDLMPGASYKLKYRPAWLVFLDGSFTQVGQPMLPPGPQGGYPPPPGY